MPTNASDSAWIQQALYQLNDTGRAFIQVPSGWLFRGGYDLALRTELLENDWIDTIILLPKGFMQHTKIETVLLVLNKGAKQHDGIKMIDISDHVKQRTVLRPILSEESIKHIASVFHGQDDPDICKIVTVDEIRSKDMNLSFNKYFINEIEVTRFDLAKEKAKLEMLEQEYQAAKVKLNQLLSQI
jgi:type I restriction enzyme M protein